jgi:hypothetical protein
MRAEERRPGTRPRLLEETLVRRPAEVAGERVVFPAQLVVR